MEEKKELFLEEYSEDVEEAMKHQGHNDKAFLIEKVIDIGFQAVKAVEDDVAAAELSVKKHFGTEEEYKQLLAEELAYFTQGKEEEYTEDHTVEELETAVKVTTGMEIR